MFFRREKPVIMSFSSHLEHLRAKGFQISSPSGGRTLASRNGLGLWLKEGADGQPEIVDSGIMIGDELGLLTDLGYQKIFQTESGKAVPALAPYLHALHGFLEDAREMMGLKSHYNESLGTTNERHLYDRLEDRDRPLADHKPWERRPVVG